MRNNNNFNFAKPCGDRYRKMKYYYGVENNRTE